VLSVRVKVSSGMRLGEIVVDSLGPSIRTPAITPIIAISNARRNGTMRAPRLVPMTDDRLLAPKTEASNPDTTRNPIRSVTGAVASSQPGWYARW
jgi:hypothetical protein